LIQLVLRVQDYHTISHLDAPMKFVFLGDYIDRGPDSKGVVDYLLDLSTVRECVFLRGNHEDMFLNDPQSMMINGGYETLLSYGWEPHQGNPEAWLKDNFPKGHWDFFRKSRLWYKDSLRTYVHAGINRRAGDVENQIESTLLWTRDGFLHDNSMNGGYVVHGHTPIGIEEKHNRCNVDSGCVFGRFLTAAVFTENGIGPIDFVKSDIHRKEGPYA